MKKRPNVLWIMSDQHNANCTGYSGHPDVKTPNLDKIAASGVNFSNAFANNPICSPSRICFMTGQYMHTHQMFGNNHAEYPNSNPDTLACLFRSYGYQSGLFGKSHMIRRWDEDGFERIRYTDLCDAIRSDPATAHYFQYLLDRGLADECEQTKEKRKHRLDGSAPAILSHEHSVEHYTGEETLEFLKERDESRPFFIHMSFQRPHSPITPAPEYFDMYDPDSLTLPDNAHDFFEKRFAGKPGIVKRVVENDCEYPLASDEKRLRRCLASYYSLISTIDMEIGRTLDYLEERGELKNTIIFYTADHGDFAGEHGLFHKNLGIYDSIQRIPFLLSWPGGPKGMESKNIVESVDFYPTLCELCEVPLPEGRDGISALQNLNGESDGKDAAFCEWNWGGGKVSAIRTKRYRLVFYENRPMDGELYDHESDPGEVDNLWSSPDYQGVKNELIVKLLQFTLGYKTETNLSNDRLLEHRDRHAPTYQIHKHGKSWSELRLPTT